MILARRSIPFIATLLVFLGLEALLIGKSSWLYFLAPFLLIVVVLSIFLLVPKVNTEVKSWGLKIYNISTSPFDILISPLLLVFSSLFFLILLSSVWLRHVSVILVSFLLFLFLEDIFYYFFRVKKYQVYSLENISSYVNLVSFFFFASSMYGLVIFLKLDVWILSLGVALAVFLLAYQTMRINGLSWRSSWLYLLIIVLVCVEIFWTIGFWPTSFYINGLFLSLVFYLILNLTRYQILNKLERKIVARYLIISLVVVLITLGTARWV